MMKQTRYRGTEFTKTPRPDCEYFPVKLLANIRVDKPHRLVSVNDGVNFAVSFLDICGNPSNYFHKANGNFFPAYRTILIIIFRKTVSTLLLDVSCQTWRAI